MKILTIALAVPLLLIGRPIEAQITIDACRDRARANHPLSRQFGLIDRSASLSALNLNLGYLPQINLTGRKTTQSDVTTMPALAPGAGPTETVPKDQFQLGVELSQVVWDGGIIGAQKGLVRAGALADKARTDIDLYSLDRTVDRVFFSILVAKARIEQNGILQAELKTNADRVAAYIRNGIASQADADAIEVERVEARMERLELESLLVSYAETLSALTGTTIGPDEEFLAPREPVPESVPALGRRPELTLIAAREEVVRKKRTAAAAADLPRVSLFFQGIYGEPGLDTMADGAASDYIAGLRVSWNLGSLYTLPGNLAELDAQKRMLENEREAFLLNAEIDLASKHREVLRLKDQLAGDAQSIALRKRIKASTEVRVANGAASIPDLIRDINAENLAVQVRALHEIQLQLALRELRTLAIN